MTAKIILFPDSPAWRRDAIVKLKELLPGTVVRKCWMGGYGNPVFYMKRKGAHRFKTEWFNFETGEHGD